MILQTSLTLLLAFLTVQAILKSKQIYMKENIKLASLKKAKEDEEASKRKPLLDKKFTQFQE